MPTYPMLAIGVDEEPTLTRFTIEDGICVISEGEFILTERPGSKILKTSSIVRGSDIDWIFEGAVVEGPDGLYVISYDRGFVGYNPETRRILIGENLFKSPYVCTIYDLPHFKIKVKPIRFKSGNLVFDFDLLAGSDKKENKVYLSFDGGVCIDSQTITQHSGIKRKSKSLYFGDLIDDSELFLYKGCCCIRSNNQILDVARGEILC